MRRFDGTGRHGTRGGLARADDASVEAQVARLYRLAAVANGIVAIPPMVAYSTVLPVWFTDPPRYRFLLSIWAGMAALWGVMFVEISASPVAAERLIKYSYLEKTVTSVSVFGLARRDRLPHRLLVGVFFTDVVWIPLFGWAHLRVRRLRNGHPR
jgi:hypothetical protein